MIYLIGFIARMAYASGIKIRGNERLTVKEWLKNGRNLNFEIQALKEARSKALNAAVGSAADYSTEKVQTSTGNSTERLFVNYSQYSAELKQRISELEDYQAEILHLINKVSNSTYRTLLIEYYINCKSWEEVGADMHYSYVHIVNRLHPQALNEIDKYYDEKCNTM